MSSILSSMNIAQQALLINQAALNVVSNNIANVNTEGYSRERINLSPSENYTPIGGSVINQINSSSGVEIQSVERYVDQYLQTYMREQNALSSYMQGYSNAATSVESIMNELNGTGLEDTFTKFYEAAQTLNTSPKSSVAREGFIQQAQTLAQKFNSMTSSLQDIRTSLVGDISDSSSLASSKIATSVTQVNQKLEQIVKLNTDIVKISSANMTPNNLLDVRDHLVTELSAMLPVTITDNTNGSVNLSINGVDIIAGTSLLGKLSIRQGDDTTPAIIDIDREPTGSGTLAENINKYINSGSMGATLAAGSTRTDILTAKGTMNNLDILANQFAQIINDIQTKANGTVTPLAIDKNSLTLIPATENIFESSDGGAITAKNIQINNNVLQDPYLIAAARIDTNLVTNPNYNVNAIGDNTNMQLVLDSRKSPYGGLGNCNPESFLSAIVGDIGLKTSSANTDSKNQLQVLTQVKNQLSSATGVSMDEEVIDLSKYQRAYQASARIFSVCNDLLDVLVNLGR